MKIGIFGGSFNPPHKMHFDIARNLIDKHYVDKVIFVPTGSQYKYKDNLVLDKARLEMVRLMIENEDDMMVSDFELKDYVVYSCETLAYFKDKYPEDEIYFICGADNFSYIDKWKNGSEILANFKILVILREGNDIAYLLDKYKEYKKNIIVASVNLSSISSTMIREHIKNEQYTNLNKFLDLKVIQYIKENKIYGS